MGLSRNKVAVPEGAAGSPPFYGVTVWPIPGQILLVDHWLFTVMANPPLADRTPSGVPSVRHVGSSGGNGQSLFRFEGVTLGPCRSGNPG